MLNHRNVLSVHEIKVVFEKKNADIGMTILGLFTRFCLQKLAIQCGFAKKRGYAVTEILSVLLLFPVLMVTTVRSFMHSRYALTIAGKDAFYRLMNYENLNWRKLMYAVAKVFRTSAKAHNDQQSPVCGIIDDTLISKTGDRIERIGKVFDHVNKSYALGFRCLLYSFWDGTSIYPLDFSLHAEKGQNQKRAFGMTQKQLKRRNPPPGHGSSGQAIVRL